MYRRIRFLKNPTIPNPDVTLWKGGAGIGQTPEESIRVINKWAVRDIAIIHSMNMMYRRNLVAVGSRTCLARTR